MNKMRSTRIFPVLVASHGKKSMRDQYVKYATLARAGMEAQFLPNSFSTISGSEKKMALYLAQAVSETAIDGIILPGI
ncbi:hypothetical protein Pmar_PMAR014580 [Perkinsus marinus ATCC 50983]|uniref:Uncharacterized protein n=1 Tax=Perkinsus marinus (strain ATCC 50983 / TXsc) TaxID=423536 RepID=C5LIF9_PERM5|nr:hypothetical protein Pmar_PMAR014580 [Perkinsus marinus ATCC 50983]EER03362.1 hypothetical protein Pmar_PMAR014580 [Perkinsus marinus ATCC 50983]|eukprot:XP_002771546.1 hypothetical protein Pmar_PMAR014580 [Perkinsus marinus ATCC 50983]